MAFLTKNKALALFEEYKKAELAGQDSKAKEIEAKLLKANWKIVHSPEWTVVKVNNENSGDESKLGLFTNNLFTSPYQGTSNTGKRTWLYVGIGIGVVTLIVSLILIIRAVKRKNYAGA